MPPCEIAGLECYECLTWKPGEPGTDERCRYDQPPADLLVDCQAPNANLLDLSTGQVMVRQYAPAIRALNDPVCVKINGTERSSFQYVVFRGCAIAQVEKDLEGVCQLVGEEFAIEGYLSMLPGSKHFHCTSSGCNTGSVAGPCVDGGGEGKGGESKGGGVSVVISVILLCTSLILGLFRK